MENIDLKKLSAEQLCDLFNDETAQVKHWDIIQEFIDRKISTVNIQRASGSMNGRPMRIWYNEGRNCIEVRGRVFFEGTDLLQLASRSIGIKKQPLSERMAVFFMVLPIDYYWPSIAFSFSASFKL